MNVRALIASPLIVLMLIGTRLIIVSDYNTDTAVTLLRSGGTLDIILGAAIPLLPLLLPSASIAFLIVRQWYPAAVAGVCSLLVATLSPAYSTFAGVPAQAWDRFLWFSLGVEGALQRAIPFGYQVPRLYGWVIGKLPKGAQVAVGPEVLAKHDRATSLGELWTRDPLLVLIVSATLLAAVTSVRVNITSGGIATNLGLDGSHPLRTTFTYFRRLILGSVLAIAIAYVFSVASSIYPIPPRDANVWTDSLRRMWQPPERVTLASGEVDIGYLLGVKDSWQIILIEKGRSVRFVRPEDVKSRSVCDLGFSPRRSPFWGSTDIAPTEYPPCFPSATEQVATADSTTPIDIPRRRHEQTADLR